MDKVSVTVRIPALDGSYDFLVPDNMPVTDVLDLIITIMKNEYGFSGRKQDISLLDLSDGRSLIWEHSFKRQGITDGANLMLF